MKTEMVLQRSVSLAMLTGALIFGAGCKNPFLPAEQPAPASQSAAPATAAPATALPAVRSDQQITSDIQAKIGAESALNGQAIQVDTAGGVTTLTGNVQNDASRALAAADSGSIDGVKTVINNLVVAPVRATKTPERVPAPERRRKPQAQVAQMTPPPAMAPAPPGPGAGGSSSAASPSSSGQDGDHSCRHGDPDSYDRCFR